MHLLMAIGRHGPRGLIAVLHVEMDHSHVFDIVILLIHPVGAHFAQGQTAMTNCVI